MTDDPSTWSLDQAKSWLEERGVKVPVNSDEIWTAVRDNLDTVASHGAKGAGAAQAYFEKYSDKALDDWSESQLREYLLEQGLVSPKGGLEQMRIAAKQQ